MGRNWAYFHPKSSGFWYRGQFSKLPYMGMKLGHWPKCQRLYIYSLSTPGGRNWAYFHSTGRFSKLPYLGMKLGHYPAVAHILSDQYQSSPPPNFTPFYSTAGHFHDIGNFPFCIIPLATMLKKFQFEISKFQERNFVWIVTGNIQERFGQKGIKTVGVAFWNFHSYRVPC